jgi:hypothetical protein
MPEQLVPTLIVVALILLAFLGMLLGWRGRRRRQAALDVATPVPETLGAASHSDEVMYVATTLAERPLERIAVARLGVRGRADVEVHPEGIVIAIRGTEPFLLPTAVLLSAGLGTYTVDRVVERDGLVVITWRLGDTEVDSYLRAASGEAKRELLASIRALIPGPLTSKAGTP